MQVPTEIEASLAIAATDPAAVAEELAALRTLGRFYLVPRPEKAIRDLYMDTADAQLAQALVSIRLREANGKLVLTLKSDDPSAGPGVKVRRELELPWSEEALSQVLDVLAGYGIPLRLDAAPADLSPLQRLSSYGLLVIQERVTRRVVRDVALAPGASEPLAEMVIDQVLFRFGDRPLRHSEVEVELKAGQDRALITEALEALRSVVPGCLRPWSVPKLALGLWLEAMLARGLLEPYLAADGSLLPAAYPAILAFGERARSA